MPWARLDDKAWTNDKLRQISNDALALYLIGISYSAGELTDGYIDDTMILALCAMRRIKDAEAAIAELSSSGLLQRQERGWLIHDFLVYNKSRQQVLSERSDALKRQQEWADRHRNGSGQFNKAVTNAVSNAVSKERNNNRPVPDPVPVPMYGRDVMSNSGDEADGFARFWAAYPRKAGKNKARQWWAQRLAEGVCADDLIMAAEHYAAKLKRDRTEERYMKMPANFLGPEECWQDYASPPDDDEEEEHYQTIDELRASLAAEPTSGLTW